MTSRPINSAWQPPAGWVRITTLDAHTAGEPLRIVTGGFPEIPGKTILEKRRFFQENLDPLRKALMWEPRGHADMYGCVITEPVMPGSHMGVLFLHNEGYSSMCGHGTIAAVMATLPVRHPFEDDLGFLYGTIITGPAREAGHFGSNVCVFADGEVDRSPTGTGVSARAALHAAKGEIAIGEPFIIESLLGTCFTGRAVSRTTFGRMKRSSPKSPGVRISREKASSGSIRPTLWATGSFCAEK